MSTRLPIVVRCVKIATPSCRRNQAAQESLANMRCMFLDRSVHLGAWTRTSQSSSLVSETSYPLPQSVPKSSLRGHLDASIVNGPAYRDAYFPRVCLPKSVSWSLADFWHISDRNAKSIHQQIPRTGVGENKSPGALECHWDA